MSKGHRNLQVSAHQPGVVILAASLWVKLTACPAMGKSLPLNTGSCSEKTYVEHVLTSLWALLGAVPRKIGRFPLTEYTC